MEEIRPGLHGIRRRGSTMNGPMQEPWWEEPEDGKAMAERHARIHAGSRAGRVGAALMDPG